MVWADADSILRAGAVENLLAPFDVRVQDGATVSMADFLQSRIHKAFTTVADDLCSLGYLSTETRIAVSGAIGDVLDLFRDKMAELGVDQMGVDGDVARMLVMKYAQRERAVQDTIMSLTVKLVKGGDVRDDYDVEFSLAGHWLRYPKFIPVGEIWIEESLLEDPADFTINLLHEMIEATLMDRLSYLYEPAHEIASMAESWIRTDWAEHNDPDVVDCEGQANGLHHNEVASVLRLAQGRFWVEFEGLPNPDSGHIKMRVHRPDGSTGVYDTEAPPDECNAFYDKYMTVQDDARAELWRVFTEKHRETTKRQAQQLPGVRAPLTEEELPGTGRIDVGKKGEEDNDVKRDAQYQSVYLADTEGKKLWPGQIVEDVYSGEQGKITEIHPSVPSVVIKMISGGEVGTHRTYTSPNLKIVSDPAEEETEKESGKSYDPLRSIVEAGANRVDIKEYVEKNAVPHTKGYTPGGPEHLGPYYEVVWGGVLYQGDSADDLVAQIEREEIIKKHESVVAGIKPKTGLWLYYNYQLYTKFGNPNTLPSHVDWLEELGIKIVGEDFDRVPRGSVYFTGAYTTDERPMVDLVATSPGGFMPNSVYEKVVDAFNLHGAQIDEQDYTEAYGRVAAREQAPDTVRQLLSEGFSVEYVARMLKMDIDEVRAIQDEMVRRGEPMTATVQSIAARGYWREQDRCFVCGATKDDKPLYYLRYTDNGYEDVHHVYCKDCAEKEKEMEIVKEAQSTESDPYGVAGGTRQPEPNRFLSEDMPAEVLKDQRRDERNYQEVWGYDPTFTEPGEGSMTRPN